MDVRLVVVVAAEADVVEVRLRVEAPPDGSAQLVGEEVVRLRREGHGRHPLAVAVRQASGAQRRDLVPQTAQLGSDAGFQLLKTSSNQLIHVKHIENPLSTALPFGLRVKEGPCTFAFTSWDFFFRIGKSSLKIQLMKLNGVGSLEEVAELSLRATKCCFCCY